MALRTLSVCTGVGGLDLGLHIAVGDVRPVAYVEREVSAAEILAARIEEESLPAAPIWSDLATFPASDVAGLVDLVLGGLPCQPFSVAGKRKGEQDERFIWPDFLRIVEACRPSLVWLENVPPFVSGGYFREVGERLSALGYRIEDPLFLRASDVGAPHRRERVFILAVADGIGPEWRSGIAGGNGCGQTAATEQGESATEAPPHSRELAHPARGGRGQGRAGRAGIADAAVDNPTGSRSGGGESGSCAALRNEARLRESGRRRDAVAHSGSGTSGQRRAAGPAEAAGGRAHAGSARSGGVLADASGTRLEERECQPGDAEEECATAERGGESVADADSKRRQQESRGALADEEAHGEAGWDECEPHSDNQLAGKGADLPLFPPGPADHEAWSELLVRQPWLRPAISQEEVESIVCGLADGVAYWPHDPIEWKHDEECRSEDGAEAHNNCVLRTLRNSEESATASPRLSETARSESALPKVSPTRGQENRTSAGYTESELSDMQRTVSAEASQACHALWEAGMQVRLREIVSGEAMVKSEYEKVLHRVWRRISGKEAEAEDMQSFLRSKAFVDKQKIERSLDQRTDALRVGGNGVVAIQAAVAFVELLRRAEAAV